ncbi:hypothetical protein U3516DRAFT_538341 [Neocallimastix sp. 'constans']
MQTIIEKVENGVQPLPFDSYQIIIFSFFRKNQFFIWTCLVLLLNINKWKRLAIIVLFLHWLLRSIGDTINNFNNILPLQFPEWPRSNERWIYPFGIAGFFWYASEIIGDWYPLLRTKAIIRNKKKIRILYFICITYNIIKIIQFYNGITFIPFRIVNGVPTREFYKEDMGTHKLKYWGNNITQLIISLVYDITVITTLKSQVFNKMNKEVRNKSKFLTKFKFVSEYRIIFSMIATILAFPFLLGFGFLCVKQIDNIPDVEADFIRQCVLNVNYTLMYIDQILLHFFVESNNNNNNNNNNKNKRLLNSQPHYLNLEYSHSDTYDFNGKSNSYNTSSLSKYKYLQLEKNNNDRDDETLNNTTTELSIIKFNNNTFERSAPPSISPTSSKSISNINPIINYYNSENEYYSNNNYHYNDRNGKPTSQDYMKEEYNNYSNNDRNGKLISKDYFNNISHSYYNYNNERNNTLNKSKIYYYGN